MKHTQETVLLAIIGADPDGLKPIEIQKLAFLYSKENESVPSYDFIPYKRGCYSPTLAHDLHKLAAAGMLKALWPEDKDRKRWMLTEDGEVRVYENREKAVEIADFLRRYHSRGTELIADVYRRYPYWAINSNILDMVLEDDDETLERIEAARPNVHLPLASIGYEGRSFENYLNALIRNGIKVLCDVRRNPISRKYGFSKSTLQNACDGVGIEYRHFPELGIPSFERSELRCQSDYDDLFARYEENVLPRVGETLDVLSRLVSNGDSIALTCYEANPAQCHRTRVLNAITERTGVKAELI